MRRTLEGLRDTPRARGGVSRIGMRELYTGTRGRCKSLTMEKQTRNVTLSLVMEEPTLESVSDLVGELRSRPGIKRAGILELEEPHQSLQKAIEGVLNRYSREAPSNTPDYVLAGFLMGCIETWERHVVMRDKWHDFVPSIPNKAIDPKA